MRLCRALTQEKERQAQRNGRWQQSDLHISRGRQFGIKSPEMEMKETGAAPLYEWRETLESGDDCFGGG